MWASSKGQIEVATDKGAGVDARNTGGFTALMRSSLRMLAAVVQALLERGAAVNAKATGGSNAGGTAPIAASSKGDTGLVRESLARKAAVSARANDGETALGAAAKVGHIAGASFDSIFGEGSVRATAGAVAGNLLVAVVLAANGSHVNAMMSNGVTALMVAPAEGHRDVAQLARRHGGHE